MHSTKARGNDGRASRGRFARQEIVVTMQQLSTLYRPVTLCAAVMSALLSTAPAVNAQALKDVPAPDAPLVLKSQGSFFVGGEKVQQTAGQLGDLGPGGHITVNPGGPHDPWSKR